MSDMSSAKPDKNHEWLKKFVGKWEVESECVMGPDQPPMKGQGLETVRMLGDLWLVGESTFIMPGAGEGHAILTLGYDPIRKKFVGT